MDSGDAPVSVLVPTGDHYALQVGARALRGYCAPVLTSLLVSFREDSTGKAKQNNNNNKPPTICWAESEMSRKEQKCPLEGDKQQWISLKLKLFKIAGLKRFVFWKANKPAISKQSCPLLQANLTADQGSKYIKIFYPIICFDQLTTILKIQSWGSWQVQLPNFIEEFFFSLFPFFHPVNTAAYAQTVMGFLYAHDCYDHVNLLVLRRSELLKHYNSHYSRAHVGFRSQWTYASEWMPKLLFMDLI